MKPTAIILVLLFAVLGASCSSGGTIDNNNAQQHLLEISQTPGPDGVRTLHLLGPRTNNFGTVTYYVFGNDEDFGENSNVPLEADRHDEIKFGPLAFGEELRNVDLSPWARYEQVYVRAIGPQPNRAYKISPGTIYTFTTN